MLQAVTIICGFILPRLILMSYGSEVNGLIQSISQFLGIVTFLEMGVGQVVQSSLYAPIAENNHKKISVIIKSAELFFNKIAKFLFIYIAFLLVFYPFVANSIFDRLYIVTLIIVIALSLFAQYYYGIIDNLLLNADQKVYIQNISQILSVILNTCICVFLMKNNFGIHIVKLATSFIYVIRPLLVRFYVNKNYKIDRKIKYEVEPITQKWNGVAQHISGFVLAGTDNIVLTLFSTLQNVSIYSVYYMIIYGVFQIYQAMMGGINSLVGTLLAKKEKDTLYNIFSMIEVCFHFIAVYLYSCTRVLIIPFITVYTDGITDINYVQPVFATLIILAYFFQCIKSIYNCLILAGSHYRETQKCHINSAIINLLISIIMVRSYGLIGIALGTLISMAYQTIWMAWYNSKNFIYWPFANFIKQILIDVITACIIIFSTSWITLQAKTYLAWTFMAFKIAIIAGIIVIIVAYCAYPDRMKKIFFIIKEKLNKNSSL